MVRRRKIVGEMAGPVADLNQQIPGGPKIDYAKMLPGFRPLKTGWTPERLQRFFDVLAHTGCVLDACHVAGISDASAYKMKARFPLFAAAWEDALNRGQQGLVAIAYQRAVEGRETVIIRKGEEYERRITPSDAMLGLLLKRGDALAGIGQGGGSMPAELKDLANMPRDEIISWPEWRDGHMRFNRQGRKYAAPDPEVTDRLLSERCQKLLNGLYDRAQREEACPCCDQKLPPDWPQQSLMAMTLLGVVDIKDHFEGIPLGEE